MAIVLPVSPEPRASILIVSARHGKHLRACLEALARNVPAALRWEVVLVLNRADPDVLAVAKEVSGLEVERSTVDLGLAGGLNRARARARGDLLCVLHDDTEVEPGWLEGLLDVAADHPEAGAVGSWVLNMDGSSQLFGGVLWRDGKTHLNQPAAGAELLAVDYTGSSSMMVRASTWDAVGGAGEEFYPAVFVDVDLALKIWGAGQAVLATSASRLRHVRSASTTPEFRHFLYHRNRARLVAKWSDALAMREPRGEGSAAVERALARAETRWRACAPLTRWTAPRALDVGEQERRHLEAAADLQRDWALQRTQETAAIRAELGRARTELDGARAELERTRAQLERSAAARARLEGPPWRRLYRRLLPLWRAVARLSRRRGASRTE